MFICICNALTEKQVDDAIDNGAHSAEQVYAAHGCAPQCGKCVCEVKERIGSRRLAMYHRVSTSPTAITVGVPLPVAAS